MNHAPEQNHAPKDDQNVRYALTVISYILLVVLAMTLFYVKGGTIPTSIPPYDFILLALACFRLIRLFTYDQIMRVVRDFFLEKKEYVDTHGVVMIVRSKAVNGGRRSLTDLLGCPWCMGMWVSFFLVLFYFLFPPIKYLVLLLALAGVASALQIFMNGIGARAEFYRKENNLHN